MVSPARFLLGERQIGTDHPHVALWLAIPAARGKESMQSNLPLVLQSNSLYAMIVRIQNVDPSLAIKIQSPWIVQLARFSTDLSPAAYEFAIQREFLHATVTELADVDMSATV